MKQEIVEDIRRRKGGREQANEEKKESGMNIERERQRYYKTQEESDVLMYISLEIN